MPATRVDVIDGDIRRLAADMLETMYQAPGVGLAAPQIGVTLQVVVFDIGDGPHVMVIPVLLETSGKWTYEEGCLSVPERFWPISRASFARAKGLDLDGNEIEYAGEELMGRVLQHETDHLQGVMLLERLSRRARKQALKEIREETLGFRGPR